MSSVATVEVAPWTPNTPGTGPEGVGNELWTSGRRTRAPPPFALRAILK